MALTDFYSEHFDRPKYPTNFNAIRLKLASPEKIRLPGELTGMLVR